MADDAADHLNEHRISKITAGELNETRRRSLVESVRREVDREIVHQVEHAALRADVPVPKVGLDKEGATISDIDGEDPVCLHVEIEYSNDALPGEAVEFQTLIDLIAEVENGACS
ncbi:hypothetical protein ACFVMC_07425 [Nocardia sp. NPDC127579]|uniref:hypothetical protein n=1 Tax=Nocardia sp. NPDC127579 TaxID=3345402 RepID=UPI0036281A76